MRGKRGISREAAGGTEEKMLERIQGYRRTGTVWSSEVLREKVGKQAPETRLLARGEGENLHVFHRF